MRKFKLTLLSLSLFTCVIGQGISFDTSFISWEQVLQKAKQSNKPIFVDVYTSWCGPCKWMDINVFKDEKIGTFYNKNFLSLKVDAEKKYGVSFTKSNNINAFPTYLFFSPNGEIILSGVGAHPKSAMIQLGVNALENWHSGISLQDMKAKAAEGNKDPVFLLSYLKRLSSTGTPNSFMIEEYLKILPKDSLFTDKTLMLVSTGYFGRMPVDGIAFKVLMNAYQKYPIKSGELMSPWNTLRSRLLSYTDSAGILKDTTWLNEILNAVDKMDTLPQILGREKAYFFCKYYAAAKDTGNFKRYVQEFATKYIIGVNVESLYQLDQLGFKQALHVRGNNKKDSRLMVKMDNKDFVKTYYQESRILVNEVMDIAFMYNQLFGKNKSELAPTKVWVKATADIYGANPIFVNSFILNTLRDYYTAN